MNWLVLGKAPGNWLRYLNSMRYFCTLYLESFCLYPNYCQSFWLFWESSEILYQFNFVKFGTRKLTVEFGEQWSPHKRCFPEAASQVCLMELLTQCIQSEKPSLWHQCVKNPGTLEVLRVCYLTSGYERIGSKGGRTWRKLSLFCGEDISDPKHEEGLNLSPRT
jgi:hypothetical protein